MGDGGNKGEDGFFQVDINHEYKVFLSSEQKRTEHAVPKNN